MAYVELMEINMVLLCTGTYINMSFSMIRRDVCLFSLCFIFLLSAQSNGNINNIKTMYWLTFIYVSG